MTGLGRRTWRLRMLAEPVVSLASVGASCLAMIAGSGLLLGSAPRTDEVQALVPVWELRLAECRCGRYRCSGVRRVWVRRLVAIEEEGQAGCVFG